MWADLDGTSARLGAAANELDFLEVCLFSAIGFVLSFCSVLALADLPEIMALL